MSRAKILALLVTLALVVASCGDDGDAAAPDDEGSEAPADARGSELDDGIAAVVDGEEITVDSLEERIEALRASPAIAEQLEGEDGEETAAILRAEILSTAIVTQIVTATAEELQAPVSAEDVAEARSELEDSAGGPEALAAALEQQGLTEAELDLQLQGLAGLRNIQEALATEAGEDIADEERPEDGGLTPSEERAQAHVEERIVAADVIVNDDFGTWDGETGQITPPGASG